MTTKDRLVTAMRELMWERGYTGTSPRAVLERAGAGQGSMYHHFAGKQELASEALDRNGRELREAGEAVFDGPGSVLERITAYLRRERPVLMGCPIGRMTEDAEVIESDELRRPIDEALGWYRSRLAELLREGQATGELSPTFSATSVAAAVAATLQGAYVLAKAAQSIGPYEDAITGVLELLAAQRLPQAAARSTDQDAGDDR